MEQENINDELLQKAEAADANPKSEAKRPRGRPKGSGAKDSSEGAKSGEKRDGSSIPTKVLCYPIVKAISVGGVVVLKDKRAEMQIPEAELMAETMAGVFDKHLPALLGNYGAEIALGTALAQYGARLFILSKQIKEEKNQAAKTHNPENSNVVRNVTPNHEDPIQGFN